MPRLLDVRVESFARFVNPFRLTLDGRGLLLVEGENLDHHAFDSNGAGKSMLFEAITWALYGKLARYGDARIGGEEVCYLEHPADVTVEFQTRQGFFSVRRHRRRSGSPVLEVSASEDGQEYTRLHGTGVHADAATEDVASLLGIDYRTLRGAIFLQGSGFDIAGSTYAKQIKMLESILRFDDFTRSAKIAADRARALEIDAQRIIDQMATQSAIVEQARHTIAELEALDESAEELRIIEQIRATRDAQKKRKTLDVEFYEADVALREAESALQIMRVQRAALERQRRALNELTTVCPTCLQAVSKEHVEKHALELDGDLQRAGVAEDLLERDVLEAQPKVQALHQRLEILKRQEHSLPLLEQQLTALRARAAQRLGVIVAQTERANAAEAILVTLTEQVGGVRQTVQIGQNWRADFETLKAQTLGAAGPILNQAAERYEMILADGALHVEFSTQRESRSEDLLRIFHDRISCSYESLSNGERRRVDLIVALSLRAAARWRLPEPINLCVWDEVFDKLDQNGLQRAVEVLQQDLSELSTVFVITHSSALREMFPRARPLLVRRQNGHSEVIE